VKPASRPPRPATASGDSGGNELPSVIAELRALGSEENRTGIARFGINTARAFGISMKSLEPLARKYRRDHRLAAELWASGHHEARLLAVLIDDPKEVTPAQMDRWAGDVDSWDLCDQACLKLFVRTPFVEEKIAGWAADEREFVRRAGFALLASYAVHGKETSEATFVSFLGLMEVHSKDGRNFVRKAVNWALRQIGKRSPVLLGPALKVAGRLAASDDKTARWIGKDAMRELQGRVR